MSSDQPAQTRIIDWSFGNSPLAQGELICAIGNFDGVHKGHQAVIAAAKICADQFRLPLAVVTFSPHPRQYFRPSDAPFLLQTKTSKNACLAALGVEIIIHIHFNKILQKLSPEAFVEDVLIKAFSVKHLFAGSDFEFGKSRAGSMDSLAKMGKDLGLAVHPIDIFTDKGQMAVSSSRIRAALQAGQIDLATDMLGRRPSVSGLVVMGDQRGRLLDFPTANLELGSCLEPAFGVYAVIAELERLDGKHEFLTGVTNIGRRPTVNNRGVLAETYLFDFNEEIYGCHMTVHLQAFLRPEQKFDGLDDLRDQIAKDAEQARQILK
jgi:riboflavin kinase/FMN adenylyltransferase